MADIFLSYAHEDIDRARLLARALEAEGWDVFLDRKIPPGKAFEDYLEERLRECRAVVVLWSPHSVASQWVRIEASHGRDHNMLIPVLIAAAEIPFGYRHLHAADLAEWQPASKGSDFDELVRSIHALAPRRHRSASPTLAPSEAKAEVGVREDSTFQASPPQPEESETEAKAAEVAPHQPIVRADGKRHRTAAPRPRKVPAAEAPAASEQFEKERSSRSRVILAASFVVVSVSFGLIVGGDVIFYGPMRAELGWDDATMVAGFLLTSVLGGLFAPISGFVADKYGVRRLMVFGTSVLAVSMLLHSQIASPAHYYLLQVLLEVSVATCGILPAVFLVARRFVNRRGLAVGVVLAATNAGIIVFEPLTAALMQSLGWRLALGVLALASLALIPLILLLVRETPSEAAHQAAGGVPAASPERVNRETATFAETVRTRAFLALAVITIATYAAMTGIRAHLGGYWSSLGSSGDAIANASSLLFWAGLAGKLLFGYLADRFSQKRVLVVGVALALLGSAALASSSGLLSWPSVALAGVAGGGTQTLVLLLALNSFNTRAPGQILGTVIMVGAFGAIFGPRLMTAMHAFSGSYQLAFAAAAALCLGALGVCAIMGSATTTRIDAHSAASTF